MATQIQWSEDSMDGYASCYYVSRYLYLIVRTLALLENSGATCAYYCVFRWRTEPPAGLRSPTQHVARDPSSRWQGLLAPQGGNQFSAACCGWRSSRTGCTPTPCDTGNENCALYSAHMAYADLNPSTPLQPPQSPRKKPPRSLQRPEPKAPCSSSAPDTRLF